VKRNDFGDICLTFGIEFDKKLNKSIFSDDDEPSQKKIKS